MVDGNDITNEIQHDNIGFENKNGSYYISVNSLTGDESILFGTWSFENNKSDLNINLSAELIDTNTSKTYTIYIDYYFKIKELKYKEIKLEGTSKTTLKGKIETSNLSWILKQ